jgi:Lrp/AsnC ligand binding domain
VLETFENSVAALPRIQQCWRISGDTGYLLKWVAPQRGEHASATPAFCRDGEREKRQLPGGKRLQCAQHFNWVS